MFGNTFSLFGILLANPFRLGVSILSEAYTVLIYGTPLSEIIGPKILPEKVSVPVFILFVSRSGIFLRSGSIQKKEKQPKGNMDGVISSYEKSAWPFPTTPQLGNL